MLLIVLRQSIEVNISTIYQKFCNIRFSSSSSIIQISFVISFEPLSLVRLFSLTRATLQSNVWGLNILKGFVPNLHAIPFTSVLGLDIIQANIGKSLTVLRNGNGCNGLTIKLANPEGIFVECGISLEVICSSVKMFAVAPDSDHVVFVGFEAPDDECHCSGK